MAIAGVVNVHHLHLWSVGEHDVHLEAHIVVDDMMVSETDALKQEINRLLLEKFGVTHPTLQIEVGGCDDGELIRKRAAAPEGEPGTPPTEDNAGTHSSRDH